MRASWKGYLRFGQLTTPVKLYSGTRSTMPKIVRLHAKDYSPITRQNVCMKDGEELQDHDILRAVEYKGKFVEFNDNELEEQIDIEKDIVVRQITDKSGIDPVYYDTPYFLVADTGGEMAYSILRRALEKTKLSAIATFIFYGRERLATISSTDDLLRLHTLRFFEEITPRSNLSTPALPQAQPNDINNASKVLESYATSFHGSDYRNRYIDELQEFISRKSRGLPPKKRSLPTPKTTPENQVGSIIKSLLGKNPEALSEAK